jgi:hypothetical protein
MSETGMSMIKLKHGGARPGSGRKRLGRKAYLVRMKPETMGRLKETAKPLTPGQYLDREFAK